MQNALNDESFQDTFLRFFVSKMHQFVTLRIQFVHKMDMRGSCEFGNGWNTIRAFGTHGKMEAFGNRKGHFPTSEQSCTLLLEELGKIG